MSAAGGGAVCRCCLRSCPCPETISVFSRHKSTVTYADMIRKCCSLHISVEDEMPSHICPKCAKKLKSFYNFRKMCHKINNILLKNLKTCNIEMDDIKIENEDKSTLMSNMVKIIPSEENETTSVKIEPQLPADVKIEPDNTQIEESTAHYVDSDVSEGMLELSSLEIGDMKTNEEPEDRKVENCLEEDLLLLELVKTHKPFVETYENKNCDKVKKENIEFKFKKIKSSLNSSKRKWSEGLHYMCNVCNKNCRNEQRLADHVNWVHKGIKFYCELCEKYYTSKWTHMSSSHTQGKQCSLCGVLCASKAKYYTHMQQMHRKEVPHVCKVCNTVYPNKAGFNRHVQTVHGEAKFVCQYCSRVYRRKDKLDDHIKTHTKEKPFACDICPYRFPTRPLLKRHKLRHTAQKTIRCDHCDAMFRTKADLRQHITRHDVSAKRYACAVCGKLFRRSDHRNTHQRAVHKLDPSADRIKSLTGLAIRGGNYS